MSPLDNDEDNLWDGYVPGDDDGDNSFEGYSGGDNGSTSSGSNRSIQDRVNEAKEKSKKLKEQHGKAGEKPAPGASDAATKDAQAARGAGTTAKGAEAAKGAQAAGTAARGAATAGRAAAAAGTAAGVATGPVGWAALAASLLASPKIRKGIEKAVIVILLLIISLLLLVFGGGVTQHISTKELTTESNSRIGFGTIQVRYGLLKADALFTSPDGCGEPVYCRLTPGVSQEEIDKLRRQEIIIEDSDIAGSGDGMYLKQLRYRDTANTEIRTTNKSDFAEKYREDSFLYEKIERVTSSGSIYYRSPRSVERFALYGATRNNPYDEDATNVEVLVKTFRETVFGQSGKVQELGYGLNGPIDTRASEIQSSMMQSGVPETITANTTAFDTAGSDGIIQEQIDADSTKTAVLSAFDGLESKEKVCSFVFGIDAMNFNIKLTKARALAKYAGHLLTMADANKVGAVTGHHVALINGIQVAKSEDTDSYKLAFDQSEGYLLVSQGLIETDRKLGGLTRSTSGGNPSLLYLNQLLGNLNFATPVDDATSDPFYTTDDLKQAYNSDDPCETLYELTGDPSPSQLQLMRMILGQYMTPQFTLNKAGAINPDPRTDLEKGYGSGNAMTAGAGALNSGIGRAIGMEALYQPDMEKVIADVNKMSHFPGYNIDKPGYKDNYRNKLCNDRSISGAGIATDMFCNIQWGYTQEVLLGSSYSPREVIGYLRQQKDWPTGSACYSDSVINANPRIKGSDGYNDPGVETSGACLKAQKEGLEKVPHIDENGSVSTQRYRDYMSNCIESDKPIIDEFNWGENQYGSQSAAYCALNRDEIFRYFRLFVFDTNILEADQQSIFDTLGGAANALVANNSGSGASSGGVFTPSGTVQQLAQNLLACSNATLSTGTWLSSGVSPLQQVTNMANGLPAIPGYSYSVNPKILQVLVAMCQKYKFTITSLVRTTMTADGVSVHPYGLAVDIGSIGSNGLETLDATYRAFLIDAQSLFQEMNTKNTFGVYPSLEDDVEQFITYSYVFPDAGTGGHLHIGLNKSELITP